MIKPIQCILYLLRGNITFNDTVVPVIKRSYPLDKTPCITIDDSGGVSTIAKHVTNINHEQVIQSEMSTTIRLNIWCDTENQRWNIINQIKDIFNKAMTDHYTICIQYDKGKCKSLNTTCKAINDTSRRGSKEQCPKPEEYNYTNIFKQYNLHRNTFNITEPYTLDDNTTNQPVLRSIMEINTKYDEYYNLKGKQFKNLKVDLT